MALRKEPGVESNVSSEQVTQIVTGSANILVPVDSPSGESKPKLMTSVQQFYKEYGASTAPSASDSVSMLEAASLLNSTSVWVVRCHENKVFEGVTDTGNRFYVDKNNNLIKCAVNLKINPRTDIYDKMYLVFESEMIYSGKENDPEDTPPSIEGVTHITYLDIETPTYNKFFSAIKNKTFDPSLLQLMVTDDRNGGYKIYSNKELTSFSENIVKFTKDTLNNSALVKFNIAGKFSQANYIMINDTSYHIAGKNVNINYYPSADKEINFLNNEDLMDSTLVYGYMTDILLKEYPQLILGLNAKLEYSFADSSSGTAVDKGAWSAGTEYAINDVVEQANKFYRCITANTASETFESDITNWSVPYDTKEEAEAIENKQIEISTNIDELKINEDKNTITVYPNSKLIDSGFIKITIGEKSIIAHIGNLPVGLLADYVYEIDDSSTSIYKLATFFIEAFSDARNIDDYFENSAYLNKSSDTSFRIDLSKAIDYSFDLDSHESVQPTPGSYSVEDSYFSSFANATENTDAIPVSSASIIIGNTEYIVGAHATKLANIVKLSKVGLSITELSKKLSDALPTNMNSYVQNNLIQIFTIDAVSPTIESDGVSISKSISNYSNVFSENWFGVVFKSNSKAKIASYKYTYSPSTGLIDFTGEVNSDSFKAQIQFEDATLTDGYGKSQYYQYFNDNFTKLEIIPMEGERTKLSYESPSFGDSIKFNEADSGDLDVALSQLKNYKFTKWEIIADGGFLTPAGIQVLNKYSAEIHSITDSGTPEYSQKEDILNWRAQLPSSTWNVTMAYPPISDSSFDGFSVKLPASVQHIKAIVENIRANREFAPILGASEGLLSGIPIYKIEEETDRNDLLNVGINTVVRSDEINATYVNDNSTLYAKDDPMQEENIVRMANAATHVAEVWLELNAVGKFNNLKLRSTISSEVKSTIATRLKSNEPCYKNLEVICDETNGNDDSKTEVIVSAYLTPYRSTKRIKLFTIVKSLISETTNA